ncbi:MAG: fluoride efflux transporter CrcB [Candidatus Zapsychrus exili]|nr:fluoride efflux transporter CrcB [Candidatus Zapsychrus exili]
MVKVLLVGSGGFIGAVLRYLSGVAIYRFASAAQFPYATLFVNVLGCFLIGFLIKSLGESSLYLFIIVGVLGGFTTFSSFSLETLSLLNNGEIIKAASNVIFNVILCLFAVWLGYYLKIKM